MRAPSTFLPLVGCAMMLLLSACTAMAPTGAWTPPKPSRAPIPSRLIIPVIGVDARVTPSGLDASGAMVVPGAADEVAWYELAGRPGEVDNAVLTAHNVWRGMAGAFGKVATLRPGDEVFVSTVNGGRFAYAVRSVITYSERDAPLAEVFGSTLDATLTLITCAGMPDASGAFPDRVVIRAIRSA